VSTSAKKDGTQIHYKDWGIGQPVGFSHGWRLSSNSWNTQMLFLAFHNYCCMAYDHRSRGRSSQPWTGNQLDTYANALSEIVPIEAAALRLSKQVKNATLKVYKEAPHGLGGHT
jgi:non-heme chloroperoxidase